MSIAALPRITAGISTKRLPQSVALAPWSSAAKEERMRPSSRSSAMPAGAPPTRLSTRPLRPGSPTRPSTYESGRRSLDQLQQAIWTHAMSGDVAAITEGRRIIEARMRLLGLVEKAAGEPQGLQDHCVLACIRDRASCRRHPGLLRMVVLHVMPCITWMPRKSSAQEAARRACRPGSQRPPWSVRCRWRERRAALRCRRFRTARGAGHLRRR